jgi:uncharacterized protein YtpQ (UPF0354 family)
MSANPSPPLYAKIARMIATHHPGLSVEIWAENTLIINGRHLNIGNIQRLVDQDPENEAKIIVDYLQKLLGHRDDIAGLGWDDVRGRIYPRIQPTSIFNELVRAQVAYSEFTANTVIVYVIDCSDRTFSVTTPQMEAWGQTTESLHNAAMQNLEGLVEGTPYQELICQISLSQEPVPMITINTNDGYDSSRILSPKFQETLRRALGGDFCISIPSRDKLVAMFATNADLIEPMAAVANRDHKKLPYPISSHLFYVVRDGIVEFTPQMLKEFLGQLRGEPVLPHTPSPKTPVAEFAKPQIAVAGVRFHPLRWLRQKTAQILQTMVGLLYNNVTR